MIKIRKGLYKEGDVGIIQFRNTDWRIVNFNYMVMIREKFRTFYQAKRHYYRNIASYTWYNMNCRNLLLAFEDIYKEANRDYFIEVINKAIKDEFIYVNDLNNRGKQLKLSMKSWSKHEEEEIVSEE